MKSELVDTGLCEKAEVEVRIIGVEDVDTIFS